MAASQQHVSTMTPLGATPIADGTTFRVWAPSAEAVYVALHGPGHPSPQAWAPGEDALLTRQDGGFWAGFFLGVGDGTLYRYWIDGPGGEGYKRDPRALELELHGYPDCDCVVRAHTSYPWHDQGFRPPPFHDLVLYQLHVGAFYAAETARDSQGRPPKSRVNKFLDVVDRVEYLANLGINAIQPLPVVEWQSLFSRGYNNTDFFSPEMDYALAPEEVGPYLDRINTLLRKRGHEELRPEHLRTQVDQLKAMVDLCHVYGLAVVFDVVYNHAGGPFDAQSMRFLDQPALQAWWDADAYFIGGAGWAGGRIFNYEKSEVRQFLIDNARLLLDEYHADGFRYDEVTVIHHHGGDGFCRDLTATLHYHKPEAIHIAEYWDWDRATPVLSAPEGLGFDAAVHDGLRGAVRGAIGAAANGTDAYVNLDPVRDALHRPQGFPDAWRAVTHLENHDLVDADRPDPSETQPRIPALADSGDRRSWYARSRSRVALGLLLTAPGIPMLFMGQEFLEDKPWHNGPERDDLRLYWEGLKQDSTMRDFLRFTHELCWLRRRHPALRGEGINPYYTHNDDRVLAFQRWVEGAGRDVVVVVSLSQKTRWSYPLPFPVGGYWHEVFNSDAYDSLPADGGYNLLAVGNPAGIAASGPPLAGCPTSAPVVLPANGLIVLARDRGDDASSW